MLAAGTGLAYFATRNGAFAAAAAWMALINLFNLLPVVPLDGGRVVKSITCSIGTRTGLAALIAGMLLGAVLAVTADLWIFVILIPLGLLDYLYDRYQARPARAGQAGMRARLKPGIRLRPSRRSARAHPRLLSPATPDWRYCCGFSCWRWATSQELRRRCTPCRGEHLSLVAALGGEGLADLGGPIPVGREPERRGQVLPARAGDPDHAAPVGAPDPVQREEPVGSAVPSGPARWWRCYDQSRQYRTAGWRASTASRSTPISPSTASPRGVSR